MIMAYELSLNFFGNAFDSVAKIYSKLRGSERPTFGTEATD